MPFSLVTLLVMLQDQSSLRLVKVLTGEFIHKNACSIFLLGSLKWNSSLWFVIMTSSSTCSFIHKITTCWKQWKDAFDRFMFSVISRYISHADYGNHRSSLTPALMLSFALNIMWLPVLKFSSLWIVCATHLAALLLHTKEKKIYTRRQLISSL